jgi:predicted nucleotidyltransferase
MEPGGWLSGPVEGDYVETVEGLLFTVKGLHHPQALVIAYLRYVPDHGGERRRDEVRYRRVYDLDETDEYLRVNHPLYLNEVEGKGLSLQSVPVDRISRMYVPRERLAAILESPRTELESVMARFSSAISREGEVPLGDMGVSGSVLVGLATSTSDVDLIVYGRESGRRVYKAVRALREREGWVRPYDGESVGVVAVNRWGDTGLDLEELSRLEAGKVLQGLVDGRDYFIRLVRESDASEEGETSRPMGTVVLRGTVVGASDSIYTPCSYEVEGCSFKGGGPDVDVARLVSFRGKFTEQAVEGDVVEARGTLEEVVSEGHIYHRVMLGRRGDYLLPVDR